MNSNGHAAFESKFLCDNRYGTTKEDQSSEKEERDENLR